MLCVVSYFFFFFFSSRRRHTRFDCDWSSDVCSSDLRSGGASGAMSCSSASQDRHPEGRAARLRVRGGSPAAVPAAQLQGKSEERRVGKECRSRWWPDHKKKNKRLRTYRDDRRRKVYD